jgi:hypothetical protein
VTDTDISDYLSDGEEESHDTLSLNRLEAGVVAECPLQAGEGEGSRRSVSDWVRSAETDRQELQDPRGLQQKEKDVSKVRLLKKKYF